MSPQDTKAALRNLINLTIKGDPENEAAKIVSDVLQSKMQKRIGADEPVVEIDPEE